MLDHEQLPGKAQGVLSAYLLVKILSNLLFTLPYLLLATFPRMAPNYDELSSHLIIIVLCTMALEQIPYLCLSRNLKNRIGDYCRQIIGLMSADRISF